jgi:SAM-dependent methyltransferase
VEDGGWSLLGGEQLEASSVVANSAMNRLRGLDGANSYAHELGFNPLELLLSRAATGSTPAWLDLCCGSGRALIEAATRLRGRAEQVALVGVDLVDFFEPHDLSASELDLVSASVASWAAPRRFDLITCVHGLHYVGDKLGVLAQAARWLSDDGLFVADLDLDSVRRADGAPAGRRLIGALSGAGFDWDGRRHRLTRAGSATVALPYRYLGADDRFGPGYTGQPAVASYYEELR